MSRHPLETAKSRYPLPQEHLEKYLKKGIYPPVEISQLVAQLFCGTAEQQQIKMPAAGNANLLLTYKGYEGSLASWQVENEEMKVLALQGAKSQKSWRVSKAVNWIKFFAEESLAIAQFPDTGIRRITMPDIRNIENFYDSGAGVKEFGIIEAAAARYQTFIAIAMLHWSEEEKQFVKDIQR